MTLKAHREALPLPVLRPYIGHNTIKPLVIQHVCRALNRHRLRRAS